MQLKLENQTAAVSQNIYTAGATDEIIQINIYAETISGIRAIGINLSYTDSSGPRTLSPSTDFQPYTLKVSMGTSIDLLIDPLGVTEYNVYLVTSVLWQL